MDFLVEMALEAADELVSAGIDIVVEKAAEKRQHRKEQEEKQMAVKSLIINPGSTSTKIGVFEDENLLFEETLRHSTEEISQYATIFDQKDFRKKIITDLLESKNFDLKSLNVVVGRGGMLKPIPGGTYAVTDELLADLKKGVQGQHASNLGGILAREIGDSVGIPSFIVDPVVVDELMPIARYSGVPELPRTSVFHALNQKAVAKRYAKETGKPYESLRLIVVHMGGGVSVGAHENGKVVDVFNALDGDGAFSPERAGAVPSGALIKMCFSGEYTEKEIYGKVVGKGYRLHGLRTERQGGSDHCHRRYCLRRRRGCSAEGEGGVDCALHRISRRG